MHKYFLIPVIIFFIIICLLVIYSQYFYVDWKYDFIPESFDPKTERYKEKILPEICDDDAEIKIIKQTNDFIEKRVWKDQAEITNVPSIHAIYFLPCDGEDREFDVNGSINSSIKSINVWFLKRRLTSMHDYKEPTCLLFHGQLQLSEHPCEQFQ